MANFISADDRTQLIELYLAMFNRAPDAASLDYWAGDLLAGKSIEVVADTMYAAAIENGTYTQADTVETFINKVYLNTLGRDATAEDISYWSINLEQDGWSEGEFVLAILEAAKLEGTEAEQAYLANRTAVADYFANNSAGLMGAEAVAAGVAIIAGSVTVASAAAGQTPEQALASAMLIHEGIQAGVVTLTVGEDKLVGTVSDDAFFAEVAQNALGEQTNELGTGDVIDGGAGTDALVAIVQQASALNQGPDSGIMPRTRDVEIVQFTALSDNDGIAANSDEVVINAKAMLGLDLVSSFHSDADLIVQNLTTLTDSGNYDEKRETSAITIRMDHSGNGNVVDAASDMVVLFDNDYLLGSTPDTTTLELRFVNAYSLAEDGLPVVGFTSVSFQVGDQQVQVELTDEIRALEGQAAYQAIADAIDAALNAQGIDNVSVSVLPVRDAVFTDDVGGYNQGTVAGTYSPILLTSVGADQRLDRGVTNTDNSTINANFLNTQLPLDPTEVPLVTATIELEKVGRGAEGGELVVGGMATDYANEWDYSASALEEGVEQFNITVFGDATQNSSLASLKSTNNTLQVVNVESFAGSEADLYIGNSNTAATADGASLKDVRLFNSTAFANDVILTQAVISAEATAKYFDLQDDATDVNGTDPAADNVDFEYNFGVGNDTLQINIDKSNLDRVGSTTREDFSFTANMGNGNDNVTVQIGNGFAAGARDAWYVNSTLNQNLAINAGAGDDTVTTVRSGTWQIDMGTGSDTVYSDNSGAEAVWVFNALPVAAAQELDNLTSSANNTFGSLFKADLTVTFRGIDSTIELGVEVDTDLELNQYIKAAINSDPVLSKLLVANDGPANTLVVTSLVDGAVVAGDLSVSFAAPVAADFSASDVQAYNNAYGTNVSADQLATQVAARAAALTYNPALANDDGTVATVFDGSNSTQISESTITVDLDGTDVIVLSTSALSEETIILEGTQDDEPLVILNFDATDDTIQYRSDAGLETTRVNGDQVEIWNAVDAVWVSVATVDFAAPAGGGDEPPPPPGPVQTEVTVADLQTYDASTGAFKYLLNYSTAGVKLANINGFGDDDTIEIVGAPATADLQLASSSADSIDFVYGLADFSNTWAITMGNLDTALVAEVVAAPDLVTQVGVLDAAWNVDGNVWLVGA